MAVSITKAGPYYSSGQISFSSLRTNFRSQQRKVSSSDSETFTTDTAPIKASELLRVTDTTNTNPTVPDATENSSIASSSNLKLSQFRNSIKYYYITQSDTNTNFDIDSQSWNSNLDKNIVKVMFIDGICGSETVSSTAASLDATSNNLTIDVYGDILGAGGYGGASGEGGADAITGQDGGDALSILPPSGNNIVVFVREGSRIYGGGGGGEKGKTGANGKGGRCEEDCGWKNTFCQGNAPDQSNCPDGTTAAGARWIRCCTSQGGGCVEALWELTCCYPAYDVSGGAGGAGGAGGTGRGYNNQEGSLEGAGGVAGGDPSSYPHCGAEKGGSGEKGGFGGEWGTAGQNTANSGSGGSAGEAIIGSNYSVTGSINSLTIKGLYLP